MNMKSSRKYTMTSRAESTAQSANEIIRVIRELWVKHSIHEITLEMVAKNANLTVRTILRKYGSKEGVFEAAIRYGTPDIRSFRDEAQVGDIALAVSLLIKEYEYMGAAVIRTLEAENELSIAAKILKKGRLTHKTWCAHIFGPYLPKKTDKNYSTMLGAFYAATDVYKWKLLRKDLGYSKTETEEILLKTVQGLTKLKTK
jgi:Bacterial regulatory proteins, tetR family